MTVDDRVRAQLDRVLSHALFAAADRRARLLRFLVERRLAGQAEALKESVIAVEVFDRPTDHDPKVDSLVRVEMGRLRSRLIEYYAGAGKSDPVRIEIPRGSYSPAFIHAAQPELAPELVSNPLIGRPAHGNNWTWAAIALTAICAIALSLWFMTRPAKTQPTVAVLPFVNLTGDPANEFLSDGIADELMGVLAAARSLRVVARTSAFQFKGKAADIRDIGRALHAGALLEGSVALENGKWRIIAQLIRSSDGHQLWFQTFDFPREDLQKIEGEVARATLRTLAADQPNLIPSSPLMSTKNPAAYDLALRARAAFLRGTLESVPLSVQLAQQSIDKDPSYPVPYYLRGIAESTLGRLGLIPAKESLERSLASFEQALKLNPSYGDAHAMHAVDTWFYYWDWPRAEEEFKLAVSLGAQQAPNLYGATLAMHGGRTDEAHRQLARAEELDPVAAAPRLNRAGLWAVQGEIAKSRAEYGRVLEQNPNEITAIIALATLNVQEKNCKAAARELAKLDKIGSGFPFSRTTRAYVWANCGRRDEARKLRDELDASHPPGLSYFGLALVDGALEDYERGFAHLDKAADAREAAVLTIRVNPAFKPLAKDPRYIALVKRLRLDQ